MSAVFWRVGWTAPPSSRLPFEQALDVFEIAFPLGSKSPSAVMTSWIAVSAQRGRLGRWAAISGWMQSASCSSDRTRATCRLSISLSCDKGTRSVSGAQLRSFLSALNWRSSAPLREAHKAGAQARVEEPAAAHVRLEFCPRVGTGEIRSRRASRRCAQRSAPTAA